MPLFNWKDRGTRRDLARIALLTVALVMVIILGRNCGPIAGQFFQQLDQGGDAGHRD